MPEFPMKMTYDELLIAYTQVKNERDKWEQLAESCLDTLETSLNHVRRVNEVLADVATTSVVCIHIPPAKVCSECGIGENAK